MPRADDRDDPSSWDQHPSRLARQANRRRANATAKHRTFDRKRSALAAPFAPREEGTKDAAIIGSLGFYLSTLPHYLRPSQILPIDGDGRVDESTRPPLTATGRAHGLSNAPNAHTPSPTRDNNEHDAHTRAPDDTRGRGQEPRASPETDTSLEAARRDVIAWHATLDRPCPL